MSVENEILKENVNVLAKPHRKCPMYEMQNNILNQFVEQNTQILSDEKHILLLENLKCCTTNKQ